MARHDLHLAHVGDAHVAQQGTKHGDSLGHRAMQPWQQRAESRHHGDTPRAKALRREQQLSDGGSTGTQKSSLDLRGHMAERHDHHGPGHLEGADQL